MWRSETVRTQCNGEFCLTSALWDQEQGAISDDRMNVYQDPVLTEISASLSSN